MRLIIQFTVLFGLSAALCLATSWSGTLVDARCYAAEERNVNPTDTLTSVDRDGYREIRYCAPKAKTKSFAVVQPDGQTFVLDSAGNVKASELVRQAGRKHFYEVAISGEFVGKAIQVESISVAPQR